MLDTVRRAVEDGALDVAAGTVPEHPEHVVVESPPRRGHGDYALGLAFRLARGAGTSGAAGTAGAAGGPAHEVARVLGDRLRAQPGIGGVRIEGGGFLNITLDAAGRAALLAELTRQGAPAAPDEPAADIAGWADATGDDPGALAVRTASASPLFRVQYAHARTHAILRNARELGLSWGPGQGHGTPEPTGRTLHALRTLRALLADQARLARRAASDSEHGSERGGDPRRRHARHLEAIASAFFDVCEQCPPLPRGDEKPTAAHRDRLALVEATKAVLAGGLSQLGITAPAHL